jgi:hypothetical protein
MSATRIVLVLTFVLACPILFAACGKGTSTQTKAPAPDWLLAEAPAGDVSVSHAKSTAAEGEKILLMGRIGGRRDPISADSATFILIDAALPSCADNPADRCATPWDYFCETPESLVANTATIQIVDSAGLVRSINLKTLGIAPLDTVVITGTVAARPNPQTLVIKADTLHRATP